MTISPAVADAQAFPGGEVQFSATGRFSKPPSPAVVPFQDPHSGSWLISNPSVALIDPSSGSAQCMPGNVGNGDGDRGCIGGQARVSGHWRRIDRGDRNRHS
jgi:hypothetical protein